MLIKDIYHIFTYSPKDIRCLGHCQYIVGKTATTKYAALVALCCSTAPPSTYMYVACFLMGPAHTLEQLS